VIKDADGSLAGCHDSREEAEAQIAALYASEESEMEPKAEYQVGSTTVVEALTKDGHGRGDFLIQGDPEDPSTWHLPVKTNGTPDRRLMGGAKAALTAERGFRGRPYEGPDKQEAIRKLRAMYDAEGLNWTTAESAQSPVEQVRNLIEQALSLLSNLQEDAEPMTESSSLSEAATGYVIGIEEKEIETGKLTPLTLDIAVIEPGPGNAKDGHYYPAEVLKRDAAVFKGAKMYASDHRQEEKSVGTWVSTIKNCPVGFTESGAPIARVVVHKDWFAKDILSLREAGLLDRMECSILGSGKAKKAKVGETEYNVVEAITSADSVDWVTRAGAGGRALALAESDTVSPDDGGTMDKDKEVVQEAETVTLREEENGEQPQESPPEPETTEEPQANDEETPTEAVLSADSVEELLKESGLGEDAQRLLVRPYKNEQAVRDAIAEFKKILKRASGSGQPFDQGASRPAQQTQLTEAERMERYRKTKQRYGLDYPLAEVK